MADSVQVAESVGRRYAVLRAHLDERQRRLLLGSEAAELSRGGIKMVGEATGVHPDTVARGVRELAGDPETLFGTCASTARTAAQLQDDVGARRCRIVVVAQTGRSDELGRRDTRPVTDRPRGADACTRDGVRIPFPAP